MSYVARKSSISRAHRGNKARKTFSLAKEIVEFLEAVRRHQNAESLTAALEMILREEMQRREVHQLSLSISQYYDSLSNSEVEEQGSWGEFAGKQLRRRK